MLKVMERTQGQERSTVAQIYTYELQESCKPTQVNWKYISESD